MAIKKIAVLDPNTFKINYKEVEAPNCPKCGDSMSHRINRLGIAFWGCPNFPKCRSAMDMEQSQDSSNFDMNEIIKKLPQKLKLEIESIADGEIYQIYGPGKDPAGVDPAGRVCEIAHDGEALLSAGLSEFPTWDDVIKTTARRKLAAIAWVLGASNSTQKVQHNLKKENHELKNQLDKFKLEVEYLKACLNSPILEDESDIDQQADKDIDQILEQHKERHQRRLELQKKIKKAFARTNAPKVKDKSALRRSIQDGHRGFWVLNRKFILVFIIMIICLVVCSYRLYGIL